jgi:hypothetical protein
VEGEGEAVSVSNRYNLYEVERLARDLQNYIHNLTGGVPASYHASLSGRIEDSLRKAYEKGYERHQSINGDITATSGIETLTMDGDEMNLHEPMGMAKYIMAWLLNVTDENKRGVAGELAPILLRLVRKAEKGTVTLDLDQQRRWSIHQPWQGGPSTTGYITHGPPADLTVVENGKSHVYRRVD